MHRQREAMFILIKRNILLSKIEINKLKNRYNKLLKQDILLFSQDLKVAYMTE